MAFRCKTLVRNAYSHEIQSIIAIRADQSQRRLQDRKGKTLSLKRSGQRSTMAANNNTTLFANSTLNSTNSTVVVPTSGLPSSQYDEPENLALFRRIVFSVVLLASLVGNLMVIRAIRTGPSRKPFTYYLITSLAVAELLSSICLIFLFVYEERQSWVFGEFLCILVLPMITVTFFVVTVTLASIALYRYRLVVTPHKRPPSRMLMVIFIAVTWIIPIAVAIPYFSKFVHQQAPGPREEYWCYEDSPLATYHLVRFFISFAVPVMVMILAYGVSAVQIRQHMNILQMKGREARANSNISSMNTYTDSQVGGGAEYNRLSITATTPRSSHSNINKTAEQTPPNNQMGEQIQYQPNSQPQIVIHPPQEPSRLDNSVMESERDVIKMFYVIVLVFLVCYMPYQVFFLLSHFEVVTEASWPYHSLFRIYSFLLSCFPSALHPLCYGTMSRFYAQAFSTFILCKCKK